MNTLAEREPKRQQVTSEFLGEWIWRGALLNLILDAARTLKWPESELKLAAKSGYAFRRLSLLTVVTYCYATGVYDAKEIALKISRDEILRFLCAGTLPTWQDVRDFTHRNHDLIKQSLIRAGQLAQDYRARTGPPCPANGRRDRRENFDDRTLLGLGLPFVTVAE